MKRILYSPRQSGLICIVVPAESARRTGESEQDFLHRVRAKAVPADALDVVECDETDIPPYRNFRDAWCFANKVADAAWRLTPMIGIDRAKAQGLQMERIRRARDRELAKLDIDYQRADERGDAAGKQAIAARKQALREIPQTFDLGVARTPAELAALWPEGLPRE